MTSAAPAPAPVGPGSVRPAGAADASAVHAVVRAAFGDRPPLDPPAAALAETEASLRAQLGEYGGLLARVDGQPAGVLLFDPTGDELPGGTLGLRRFGVHPAAQGAGVASALVEAAADRARDLGLGGLRVVARVELPETTRFWRRHGFEVVGRDGVDLHLLRLWPRALDTGAPEETEALAGRLAPLLRAGDLVLLSGDLGAGKTTFTRGLGAALGVRGPVTSPTFVIARVHPPLPDGPGPGLPLVHVDAYRLSGLDELDDLDLDASLAESVTVVEWGGGIAEGLAADRLEIEIRRPAGDPGGGAAGPDDHRRLTVTPVGRRWAGVLDSVLDAAVP